MEEESLEQQFAEIESYLVKLEEVEIPRVEKKLRELRGDCQKAYEVLQTIESRVLPKV